jgi:hypothetical protein
MGVVSPEVRVGEGWVHEHDGEISSPANEVLTLFPRELERGSFHLKRIRGAAWIRRLFLQCGAVVRAVT